MEDSKELPSIHDLEGNHKHSSGLINITSMATQASDIKNSIQKDVKRKAHKSLVRKSSEKRRTSSLFNPGEEKVLDGKQLRQQIEL